MVIPQPRMHASHPEASAIADDFKTRFGNDAIPAARVLRQFMVGKDQPDRVAVYETVIAILDGSAR